ncbi:MAG: hypothetical protein KAU50_08545, partial [Candidatus Marinimicrobia bacterium]|nr:hypothetical protein [Candidatus Neomarinimicrobiota bacterium]
EGEQLIYIFAINCEHCWNVVNNVKELAAGGILPVIGITPSQDYEIERFRREFDIQIPIYRYEQKAFFEAFYIWPALYYVRDGIIVGRVDYDVPGLKTLREIHFREWG